MSLTAIFNRFTFDSNLKPTIMKKNMGSTDKTIRIIIALVIAGLYFGNVITGTLGVVLLIFAVVFLLTSLVSFCPLYTIIGVNTCKTDGKKV
jgi:hypothetical protein